ncbi:MAG: flagellar basal body protein, partial [Pseudomonadota bacterium]
MAFDLTVVSMAKQMAHHASSRQSLIAENVANADTVGFRARDLRPFAEVYAERTGQALGGGPARPAAPEAPGFSAAATRPGHAGYDPIGERALVSRPPSSEPQAIAKLGAESTNGNSVSLEDQMA